MKHVTKRLTAALLSMLLLLGAAVTALPVDAAAISQSVGAESGTTGDCTWTLDDKGVLTVSGNGEMGYYPGWDADSITRVVIEEGVTSISEHAFDRAANLKSVSIPKSVTKIGHSAFNACLSLTSVTIPENVKMISSGTFERCFALQTVVLPKGLTEIGNDAFNYCEKLKSISIPDSVTSIGNNAFRCCSSIKQASLPKSLKSLGKGAFSSCGSMTTLSVPEALPLTAFPDSVFDGCTSLQTLYIPENISSIGEYAFEYCWSLTDVTVSAKNKSFSSQNGMLYNKKKTVAILYPKNKKAKSFAYPATVTKVEKGAQGENLQNVEYLGFLYTDKLSLNPGYYRNLYTVSAAMVKKLKAAYKNYISSDEYYIDLSSRLNIRFTTVSKTALTLSVTDVPKLDGIYYRYSVYDSGKKAYKLLKSTGDVSYKAAGLKPGTQYRFRIQRCYKNKDGKEVVIRSAVFKSATTGKESKYKSEVAKGALAKISHKSLGNAKNKNLDTNEIFSGWERWERISPISQFADAKGNLMLAYMDKKGKNLLIKRLSDDLKLKTVASVKVKLDTIGTVTADSKGNFYAVWGKSGTYKDSQTSVMVTKYNSKWKEIKTVSYTSKELYCATAFSGGNCDAVVSNGVLYCAFAMERRDGHQQAKQVVIDTVNMKKSPDRELYFWCSHSFGQRVTSDLSGQVWYGFHGDGYPRAFEVVNAQEEKELFHFYCEKDAIDNMWVLNFTNAQLGDIAATSRDLFLVGSSARSMVKKGYSDEKKDLFITAAQQNAKLKGTTNRKGIVFGDSVTDKGIRWLTNYKGKYFVNNPQAVATDDDKIVVMWEKCNSKSGDFVNSYYAVLDADGNVFQKAVSMKKTRLHAFERPLYKNGNVYWLTADSGKLKAHKLHIRSVAKLPAKVTLNKKTLTLKKGKSYTLKASIPKGTEAVYTWRSGNKKIATVNSAGKLTAKKKGKVTVTVTTQNGKKAVCKVTVK